nr:MAG TPA: Protein of unknown function (DUF1642) [Caudoviricetes sp.]
MNKWELIKKYNGKLNVRLNLQMIQIYKEFIHDLQQLDEPQKVKIPQFVADVIEDLREDSSELEQAFQSAWWYESDEFTEWYKKKSNRNVFDLAWLGGYEVEKEKQYLLKFKGLNRRYIILKYDKYDKTWFLGGELEFDFHRTHHTRKQLEEDGFGWVFDCPGIEVEEVE